MLGLPTASHILAVDNAMVASAYTPITLDRYERGYFDLVVKRYKGGEFSERFHKCALLLLPPAAAACDWLLSDLGEAPAVSRRLSG